jgi:hypothetical protein
MSKSKVSYLLLLFLLTLSACQIPTPSPLPTLEMSTPTATMTPLPTQTIQWFPATSTPTSMPTRTIMSTPDQRPGIGPALLHDDYSDISAWPTSRNENGSLAYGKNEFTIAIANPGSSLSSIRSEPILEDYYLEITASPSLCQQDDSYGLILRATADVFYRWVINCNGMSRLERVKSGRYTIIQDWVPSGQIPIGFPAVLKLGVWARGEEMRFFVGDVFQFGVTDPTPASGQIGLFARSQGTSAVTISFSDLTIYQLEDVPVQVTISETPSPAP